LISRRSQFITRCPVSRACDPAFVRLDRRRNFTKARNINSQAATMMSENAHAGATTIPIRDVELRLWDKLGLPPTSTDEVIYFNKGRAFLNRLTAVVERAQPRQMVEIGILDGGSRSTGRSASSSTA
jgi:hypothetical protein